MAQSSRYLLAKVSAGKQELTNIGAQSEGVLALPPAVYVKGKRMKGRYTVNTVNDACPSLWRDGRSVLCLIFSFVFLHAFKMFCNNSIMLPLKLESVFKS